MTTINLAKARELLAQAVETQGRDFVYSPNPSNCFYRPLSPADWPGDPRTKTGCLVGTALTLAGLTRHLESKLSVEGLNEELGHIWPGSVVRYFQLAQEEQDAGTTWGEAFDAAEELVANGLVVSLVKDYAS